MHSNLMRDANYLVWCASSTELVQVRGAGNACLQEGYLLPQVKLNALPLGSVCTACVLQPHPMDSVVVPHISTERAL